MAVGTPGVEATISVPSDQRSAVVRKSRPKDYYFTASISPLALDRIAI